MKAKYGHSLKRTLAFVAALTILTSSAIVTSFAAEKSENTAAVGTEVKPVTDYTKLFPGLTATKLKLSDPVFTEKDWYEYIEYEFYTEVKDGDMIYRIYQPTDYSAASIMAITDYNPREVLGGTNNITMNLGELQGILDIAAQGGSISKDYAGLNLATGIASQMNSINDVMDNSKYYSSSSFLGIPGDKKYLGVSNDSFYNATSLEIEISETESVSVCKTVAVDSGYSIAESMMSGKDSVIRKEVTDTAGTSHEEATYEENANTVGVSITDSESQSLEISEKVVNTLGMEVTDTLMTSIGVTEGVKLSATESFMPEGVGASATQETYAEAHQEVSNSVSVGISEEISAEIGSSMAVGSEHSVGSNIDITNSKGGSSADTTSIEHSLTSGEEAGVTYQHAKDMSVNLNYGVDYQYGNDHALTLNVKRVFNEREDKEVKNVGWKLCEYVVKIPYYIEAVKTDSTGEEKVLYGQYVNYNLLNGVSRVFANGYIEHWYTGELVTYADFFDGFITATELVDTAKEQQAAKVPKEGE